MTAFTSTSAAIDKVLEKREGEYKSVVIHMTELSNTDTLDLTPWKDGGKIFDVRAFNHDATIVGGATTATSRDEWTTSMVASTDVVTFSNGVNGASDVYIKFDVDLNPS